MYSVRLKGVTNKNEYEELIKVFLKPDEFTVELEPNYNEAVETQEAAEASEGEDSRKRKKNLLKRKIYSELSALTGLQPEWGILTGVRPVKLAGELIERLGVESAGKELTDFYLLSRVKADLLLSTYLYQKKLLQTNSDDVGIYIGIPFCPTRCLYCSFTSNQVSDEEIALYLEALNKEIEFVSGALKTKGIKAESIYIGGGTPTTLNSMQIEMLLRHIADSFDFSHVREFTMEAGRPDTISREKLKVMADHGVTRISINPQSMKQSTLELIGRSHNAEDVFKAFHMASVFDFIINSDIIAGLPGESPEDFQNTLNTVIKLGAQNITIHTLAVKRASRLKEEDSEYHYKQGEVVTRMLSGSAEILRQSGYRPYYLYRQKHMAGALENVGYCKEDTACIYNIRIMEEKQSIIAMGAGAISKVYYPLENRHERVANVSNYRQYIERLDEMIDRKRKELF